MQNTDGNNGGNGLYTYFLSQVQGRVLTWLHRGSYSEEDRPILYKTVNVDGAATSCDGFRLHSAPSDCVPLGKGIWRVASKIPASGGPVITEELPSDLYRYPDYRRVVRLESEKERTLRIAFDPRLLRDALAGLDGVVVFEFSHDHDPVQIYGQIKGKDEAGAKIAVEVYAVVMPMSIRDIGAGKAPTWRPGQAGNGEDRNNEAS